MLAKHEEPDVGTYLITGNDEVAEDVIRKIAEILGREHRAAMAADESSDARVILNLAHSFADEMAVAREDFDRDRFIREIVEEPS
jgi:hypothetical protein